MVLLNFIRSVCRLQISTRQFVSYVKVKPIFSQLTQRKFCSVGNPTEISEVRLEKPGKHVNLTEDVIKTLTGEDENLVKRLKLIEFEYEVAKQEGTRTPSYLTLEHWKELLLLSSISKRRKYLIYLFKTEMTRLNRKQKKEEVKTQKEADREAEREAEKSKDPSDVEHIKYGLGNNTIFLKIYDSKVDHFHNSKMMQASLFENPVIYDLDYEEHMTLAEQKNAAKQLLLSFVANRETDQPFPIQFCNVNFNGLVMKHLLKLVPSLYNPDFPINITPKSYLDLYPREKLIYLTPHCKNEMSHFDSDRIYIVGCLVDKGDSRPHSMAKAKKENIQMAKLPLDRYLNFGGGSGKSLTLNAMIAILVELKTHGDWDRALQFVPRRKLKNPDDEPDMYSRMVTFLIDFR